MKNHRKLSVHKEHELLAKLESAGLGDIEAQAVIESSNNELAKRVVVFIMRGGHEATTSQKIAQLIMGVNYLGPEAAMQHLGVKYTKRQLVELAEIPFTEGVLRECKETHILFAGYPLTIMDIKERVVKDLFYSHKDTWYDSEDFATKEKIDSIWYLIRKDIISRSTSLTYEEQLHLLNENEEVPRAVEIVYMTILYYLATNNRLFGNFYVRCQELASYGFRVCVGSFTRKCLAIIDGRWDDECGSHMSITSSRKL